MAKKPPFFELIRADHNIDFVGRRKLFLIISVVLTLVSLGMLPLNRFIKGRGHILNFSVDFRGGAEVQVKFSRPVKTSEITNALNQYGFQDVDVSPSEGTYLIKFPNVAALNAAQQANLKAAFAQQFKEELLRPMEYQEGNDEIYLWTDKEVPLERIQSVLAQQGIRLQGKDSIEQKKPIPLGDKKVEVAYVLKVKNLADEVRAALDGTLGAGAVESIPHVDSVGPKAGEELRDNGIISLLAAIGFIMLYILIRFDFRYGPGTVVALLHDAILVIGAFAITYKEFSLTTIAALLTVIGYSMNDTIVVFDRIRENTAKYRDKRFIEVVNLSINETLSRTILTSATVFFVTLAMNLLGTGVIRDFGFAMNVGVIIGTYSSIFVASPVLIWLNRRTTKKQKA